MRSIEARNPDIEFDWPRILKEQPPPEPAARVPPPERRSPRRQNEPRPPRGGTAGAPARPLPERRNAPRPNEPAPAAEPASELVFPKPERVADAAPASREAPGAGEAPSLEHVEDEGPVTATHLRLGAEGVRRLRARHSEILARISERIPDPARQDELKGQAERLNPDSWVTEEEVRLGLEQYESVLDALRTIVGQGRRRRRRSGGPRDGAVEPPAGVPSDADSPERGPVESAGGRDAEDEEPV